MDDNTERSARGATVGVGESDAKRAKMMPDSAHAADQKLPKPHYVQTIGGFSDLREPGAFWYDNTHALCHLLRDPYRRKLLLTRPPRMGKSVFCKMLGTYVDRNTPSEKFDICFRDTYIKRAEEDASVKETLDGLQRKCCWLPLTIENSIGDTVDDINSSVKEFAEKYGLEVEISSRCNRTLKNAIRAAKHAECPLVVTIDEYDRLARSSGDGKEQEIALMRDLFTALKDYPPRFVFVTGIMPLLATELSSATNDVAVITRDIEFADAVGLPHKVVLEELRRIAAYHTSIAANPADDSWEAPFIDEMTQFMKAYFNGFHFHPAGEGAEVPAMYNTQQSVAFFHMLTQQGPDALTKLRKAQGGLVDDAKLRLDALQKVFGSGIDTHTQVSTSIYDDLASCGAVLSVLTSILDEGKVKAPASFELRFKDLAQLQHQRDDQDGLDTIMSYLYSAGALTWHASDPSLLVPPNSIERELTLNKARKHHFTRSIVPLMWNAPATDDAPSWERRMERQLERLGTQLYGTEADFESDLRRMIDNSRPDNVVCKQQHYVPKNEGVGPYKFDVLLYEQAEDIHITKKVVVIELKYVRKDWVDTNKDSYKLGANERYMTFEEHMNKEDLRGRVAAAKSVSNNAECYALFIMAIHGGSYKVGSYFPR